MAKRLKIFLHILLALLVIVTPGGIIGIALYGLYRKRKARQAAEAGESI